MATGQALLDQMRRVTLIPNSLAIWGLGQMGVAIKGPDGLIYIDPHLTDSVREQLGDWWVRAYDPPLQPDEVNNASAILSSHEHLDHCDPATFGPATVASPNAKVIITGWSREILAGVDIGDDRVIVPKAGQAMTIPGTSARLTAVPSAHYDHDNDPEKAYRWFGYVIEWNGVTFYHSGDTIIYEGYLDALRAAPPVDIAMLPINGRDWYRETDVGATGNLWPREAARLALDMGWQQVIVGHNDMFPNNTITYSEIAGAFEHLAPRQSYKVLQPGELYYFVK
jgi:L-ascorbate 6-phosphate lactonase